jgi:hypothetical protein
MVVDRPDLESFWMAAPMRARRVEAEIHGVRDAGTIFWRAQDPDPMLRRLTLASTDC